MWWFMGKLLLERFQCFSVIYGIQTILLATFLFSEWKKSRTILKVFTLSISKLYNFGKYGNKTHRRNKQY